MAQDPSSLPGGGFGEEADNRTDGLDEAGRVSKSLDAPWPGRDEFGLDVEKAKVEQQAWLASATHSPMQAAAAATAVRADDGSSQQASDSSEPVNPVG